jgi:hypothetical protein
MALDQTVWIDVTGPVRETDRAVLFDTTQGEKWIPRSQMGARKKDGEKIVRLELASWWAEKELLAKPDKR